MALIELSNITKTYKLGETSLQVLKGISLTIETGEFVAIMGPSGSGKSTLMQIMGLLDRPTGGTYKLLGKNVSKLSDDEGAQFRSKTIGFIFQMFNLLPRTTALDNVILPMIYAGEANRSSRAEELLKLVGLSERLDHRPNQLSGGQQQRVAIARALANRPPLIFADEPTGNLASDQAEDIMNQLRRMNEHGITVILVTHEPEVAAWAQRTIRIKDGLVVADERNEKFTKAVPKKIEEEPNGSAEEKKKMFALELEFLEFFKSAVKAIWANKVRSALSVLGILIGVAAVIAMLALGRGAQKAIEKQLAGLGSNLLMLRPGSPNSGGVRGQQGSFSRLTLEDVKAIETSHPGIVRVDGNVAGNVQVVYLDKNTNTQLTGSTPKYESMRNARPYFGHFFSVKDNDAQERVVLLGQTVINNLFDNEDPMGKYVKIERINFRVIGILPLKGAGGFRDQDDMVLVPLKTAMNRVLGKKYLDNIYVECANAKVMPDVIETIQTLMRTRHRLPTYKDDDFEIRNMADIQAAVTSTTQTFSLLLGIVAAISLLVGGIGIMNIMLVSVNERTREIGLRKAVGAKRRAILSQFLIEATLLAVVGGLIGIIIGTTISFSLTYLANWTTEVSMDSVLLSFLFSAGVGILFGFWPAKKASLLSPIEALRYE